jgi:hypothetical protein
MDLLGKSTNKLSLVKDPFHSDKISEIHIHFYKSWNQWSGKIEFRNGETEGIQNFKQEGAENYHLLMEKMQIFIKSL